MFCSPARAAVTLEIVKSSFAQNFFYASCDMSADDELSITELSRFLQKVFDRRKPFVTPPGQWMQDRVNE